MNVPKRVVGCHQVPSASSSAIRGGGGAPSFLVTRFEGQPWKLDHGSARRVRQRLQLIQSSLKLIRAGNDHHNKKKKLSRKARHSHNRTHPQTYTLHIYTCTHKYMCTYSTNTHICNWEGKRKFSKEGDEEELTEPDPSAYPRKSLEEISLPL